jgi:hypothetical protein
MASTWIEDFTRNGPTFGARTIHGHRVLPNGIWIFKSVSYPGFLDKIAWPELNHEIVETVKVYTGVTGIHNPPNLNDGIKLHLKDFDGEEEWWAHFDNEFEAVQFVRSMPKSERSQLKTVYQD